MANPSRVDAINAQIAANGGVAPSAGGSAALSAAAGASGNPHDAPSYNPATDLTSSIYTRPITPAALTEPVAPVKLPDPPVPTNQNGTIAGMLATLGQVKDGLLTLTPTTNADTPSTAETTFKDYLKNLVAPPSTADLYQKAEADAGIVQKQQKVQEFTNTLNGIVAKANADQLSVTGQGRGIPEAIIGGQQAQISKEAAIASLPVAAQLAAAQGDLKLAQDHLATYFSLVKEDAANMTAYKNKLVDAVYNFADKQDQRALDAKKTKDTEAFTLMVNNLDFAQTISSKAIENGQPTIASKITALDPKSPTYRSDISALEKLIKVAPSSGSKTVEERKASAVALFQSRFVPGAKLPSGIPVLDSSNKMTPEAWNSAIADAPNQGLDRESFIKQFGYLIYNGKDVSGLYGLTPTEKKLVTGQ